MKRLLLKVACRWAGITGSRYHLLAKEPPSKRKSSTLTASEASSTSFSNLKF